MGACFSGETDPSRVIGMSMQQGEAHLLAALFDSTIELRVDPVDVDYPCVQANQAELIMRSFFKRYPPNRFQAAEQGSTAHLRYATGVYWSGAQAFRIHVLMRQIAPGHYRIQSVRVNE